MTGRFGALLRQLRRRAGLTQEQLAERAALGLRTVRGFETGERVNPRVHTVRRLADALGAGPDERDELAAAVRAEPAPGPVPRQLPAAPGGFVGRHRELARLTATLDGADGATVVVSAISGGGGVGKTWLALHWAHRHLREFPDGQLFVDLRGFSPSGPPMTPAEATRGLLEAIGVPPAAIPAGAGARAGRYRGLVADKRMLVVLDNARDSDQVAPLLPGGAACTVLVTSRDRLAGLVTAHSARPFALDVLAESDARELLRARLGERSAADPEATADLLASCAGLPLALAVVAARGALHPGLPLAALAAELRDTATRLARLSALDADDPAASVRAALSWTHGALDPEQAEVFALLGIAPGPDIGLPAAARLTGLPVERVAGTLRRLARISLLEEGTAGRFRLHDLVRLYATERAGLDLAPGTADSALRRLAEYSLHTSFAADRLLSPQRQPIRLSGAVVADPPVDQHAAWAWFDAEHTNLAATQRLAAARGWHDLGWQLAWTPQSFRWRRGHLEENVAMWRAGVAAAERSGDPAARTLAHRLLSRAYVLVGLHEDAGKHIERALELAEETGDVLAQANAHHGFTLVRPGRDDRRALAHALAAVGLHRSIGNRVGEAETLNTAGWHEAHLGAYERARAHCEAALALHRDLRNHYGEALTLDSLGYIAHHSGRHEEALEHYRRAVLRHRESGSTYDEADTLDRLAGTLHALGRAEQADATWRLALELYRGQHRDAEVKRVRIALETVR